MVKKLWVLCEDPTEYTLDKVRCVFEPMSADVAWRRAASELSPAGAKDALEGAGQVSFSVLGSTVTTCVVFIPLAMIKGMAGQLFTPLGLPIVFCMVASLVSAVSVVPLCYMVYRPKERGIAPFSGPVRRLQSWYRGFMPRMLKRK